MRQRKSKVRQRAKETRMNLRPVKIAVIIVLITLIVIYLGMTFYFHGHYFLKTKINGYEVGGKTAEEAKVILEEEAKDYLLTIQDREGKTYQIKGSDVAYTYQSNGEEAKLLKEQNPFAWPVKAFQKTEKTMPLNVRFDEKKLKNIVSALPCMQEENIKHPKDAYIDDTEGYKLVKEEQGNELLPDATQKCIEDAVSTGKTKLKLDDSLYKKPTVLSTDPSLTATMDALDQYMKSTVEYKITGEKEKVDAKTICTWLDVADDGVVNLNEDAVAAYVQTLATKYNTCGKVREFKTAYGDVVKIGGGDYGWIVDKEKEKEQLIKDISSGKSVKREPVYEQTAIMREGTKDYGDTYVEIDYTNQHLWYFKDGQIAADTDIVSGNTSKGNGSPDGLFRIREKRRNTILYGEDYASEVDYFLPFAYNVGIHDASWRHGEFGGSIYKYSGSHGCINVVESAAENLYNIVEEGTPVIAYYRTPIKLTAYNCEISRAYSYSDGSDDDGE
ncbi:MAG: peptidoglycan binding domain-containing protein [Lachnospiraceae bacterium]